LFHPLLDDVDISGAKSVLINVTGGSDLGLFEINEISRLVAEQADPDANVIFGTTLSDTMNGRVRVSIFVTGLTDNTFETLAKPVVNTKQHHQQHHDNQNHVRGSLFEVGILTLEIDIFFAAQIRNRHSEPTTPTAAAAATATATTRARTTRTSKITKRMAPRVVLSTLSKQKREIYR
jgi:hypothetical protein